MWVSLLFAALGFCLIAATVISVVGSDKASGQSVVALIGGTVVDSVAALFFVQSNRARRQMNQFLDKLRADRSRERAIELAGDVTDDRVRSRLLAALSLSLAEVEVGANVFRAILEIPIEDLPDELAGDEPSNSGGLRSIPRSGQLPDDSSGRTPGAP